MDRLIKTLPTIVKAAGNSEAVTEAACIAAWKFAAGRMLANHAVAVRFSEGKLLVLVGETLWLNQLPPLLSQLLFRVNSVLGQSLVNHIELRVDSRGRAEFLPGPKHTKQPLQMDQIPAELLVAASEIRDVPLRQTFLGAAMSCLRRLTPAKN